jgi:solute carrier family 45 protein 1/2/4
MVGGGFIPTSHADDYDIDELNAGSALGAHAVQWVGTPAVKGPKWAKLPLLTVGMLGIQCVWSIEMGYGESPKQHNQE